MKLLGSILQKVLLLANVGLGIGFLCCAYSPYISPERFPAISCLGLAFPFLALGVLFFAIFWMVIRVRWGLLSLAFLLLGWPAVRIYFPINFMSEEPKESIKILSYNIAGFLEDTGKPSAILSYLRDSEADVICLQEYRLSGHITERRIRKTLSAYPYRKVTTLGGGNQLACYSRYPILSAKRVSYTSQYNGSVVYRLKMGRDTLVLVNNHLESNKLDVHDKQEYSEILHSLDHGGLVKKKGKHLLSKFAAAAKIRAVQADAIADVIARNTARYLVVCGDFNDSPISYAHHTIGKGLQDTYVEAGFGPGISFHQDRFYFRIDHLFASPAFKVLHSEVDHSITASDHYPIWCILQK